MHAAAMDDIDVNGSCLRPMKPSEKLESFLRSQPRGATTALAKSLGKSYPNIRQWAREGRGFDTNLPQSRANRRDTARFFGLPLDYFEAEPGPPILTVVAAAAPVPLSDDPYPSRTAFLATNRLLEDERKHLLSLWYCIGDPGESEWQARLKSYQSLKQRAATRAPKDLARATNRVRRVDEE